MKKRDIEEELEKLKKEIQKKEEEIEKLKKRIKEMDNHISENEISETKEICDVTGEVSDLVESGFKIFGFKIMSEKKDQKNSGLLGLINDLAKLAEKSENFQKRFEINGKKGVVDFQVRTRPLKRPTTVNIRPYKTRSHRNKIEPMHSSFTPPKIDPGTEREPIVDIIEEEEVVSIIVELPGVEEKDITWNIKGDTLTIRTSTPDKKYCKEITLPGLVKVERAKSTFRNSILEIVFQKTANNDEKTM